jgi:hypothetical protein
MSLFELKEFNRNIPDNELIADLQRVSNELRSKSITSKEYEKHGKYYPGTLKDRFGTWNKAVEKAGLQPALKFHLTEDELFQNIREIWTTLGRAPLSREMKRPLSKYSAEPYVNTFGGFRKALEAFVLYANSPTIPQEVEKIIPNPVPVEEVLSKHSTKRNIPERLKTLVLIRDGNRCKLCGDTVTGEDIHFDHVIPWSLGGETILENLQILCAKHNLSKGNIDIKSN